MNNQSFNEFITKLSKNDKRNFLKYRDIRGIHTYKIIYDFLAKIDDKANYQDVNAFVIYDKALKQISYKYLGTLEDIIRNYILSNFDLVSKTCLKKEKYMYFSELPRCELKINIDGTITELYKRYNLNFKAMIEFLKTYNNNIFDIDKLNEIRKLRNRVMHHTTLLFDYNSNTIVNDTECKIKQLLIMLPIRYKNGLIKNINHITLKTKQRIKPNYCGYLLGELKYV